VLDQPAIWPMNAERRTNRKASTDEAGIRADLIRRLSSRLAKASLLLHTQVGSRFL
jgi:hypothetical protein